MSCRWWGGLRRGACLKSLVPSKSRSSLAPQSSSTFPFESKRYSYRFPTSSVNMRRCCSLSHPSFWRRAVSSISYCPSWSQLQIQEADCSCWTCPDLLRWACGRDGARSCWPWKTRFGLSTQIQSHSPPWCRSIWAYLIQSFSSTTCLQGTEPAAISCWPQNLSCCHLV